MCGICGFVHFDGTPADAGVLEAMTASLAHRGPDGSGTMVHRNCGLGHRRLAILDLSDAGAQPMRRARHVITYNGEVYNYRELRAELESLGHRFQSTSDTEVILAAYAQWGADCVSRFNGMFAFAILDTESGQLFLARDRYGIKPLYYSLNDRRLLFGSEQKAILAHPDMDRAPDMEALLEYFTFQNLFTDRTLFRDIKLFPAGCHATLRKGGQLRPTQYWDYTFREPDVKATEAEYEEELHRLFQQAVSRQLVSDTEVGAYLSGGIDSGSITAVAARELRHLKSFTCGFDLSSASGLEMGFDERATAERLSYLHRTEQYEMVLKAGDMERCLPRLAWHLEEPRVGQSYPNYYIAQLASKFVKVALAGTGGDELFGGYPWRYYRAVVNDDFEDYVDKYYVFWQRLIPNRAIKKVFAPIRDRVEGVWTRDIFRDVFGEGLRKPSTPEEYVNNSLYFEAKTFLHGLLIVEDKLSMAHGLEVRVPYLDNDLVDFAMRLPVSMKLGNLGEVVQMNENEPGLKREKHFQKTRDGKLLLRKMTSRYVPRDISEGVKQGFSAPDASWFKGESIEYVRRRLFSRKARIFDYLDRQSVLELVMEHLEGKKNRRLLVWSLLNVEQWMESYL